MSDRSSGGGWLVKVGIAVIAIGVLFGMKFCNKGKASDTVKKEMLKVMQENFPGYKENKEYYNKIFSQSHDEAFDAAYRMGGKYTKSKFNEKTYLRSLLTSMSNQAASDGKMEISKQLAMYASRIN